MEVNIVDNSFSHCPYSVAGQVTGPFEWVRDGSGREDIIFYTNSKCFEVPHYGKREGVKYVGWMLEPRSILPREYEHFHTIIEDFDIVLTHDDELLKYPNAIVFPTGGSYIGTSHGGGEEKIYDKTRFCSIVSSNKHMCYLHNFRAELADHFNSERHFNVDVFGTETGEWVNIIDSLADYKYSIVVENQISDHFFTEKIINCFLTGTVPIYIGARKIDNYFNLDGIVRFSDYDSLIENLGYLSQVQEDYQSRLPAIQDNLERAKAYKLPEERIYSQLLFNYRDLYISPEALKDIRGY